MSEEKRKMQSVSFAGVGEMLAYLPEDQLLITERLRELILECLPGVKEKLSFNVPFFSIHKNVCFIWPGAIPWGKTTWEGVELGFSYGHLLHDPGEYLYHGTRKQVYSKRYHTLEEIDEEVIRHFLLESLELDELIFREKMMNRRKR
ncbi:MAG: DUF1801 domain-containing protein [Saprospiraceae bacterium]|nr:DUF1801 domain-containing protein [Lewinella sp.]